MMENRLYQELDSFSKELELDKQAPDFTPYTTGKKKERAYRWIFLSFSALFALLGAMAFTKSFPWAVSLIFGEVIQLRAIILFICAIFAVSSAIFALLLRPEHEINRKIGKEAKYQLKKLYRYQKILHGVQGIHVFGKNFQKHSSLRHTYLDMRDKIREKRKQNALLLDRISSRVSADDKVKEELYNQALRRLREELQECLGEYPGSSFS